MKKYLVPVVVPENPPTDPVVPNTNDTAQDNTTYNSTTPVVVEPSKNETYNSTFVIPTKATIQEVETFFSKADLDADGYLTKEEIKTAFSSEGQTLSDSELS